MHGKKSFLALSTAFAALFVGCEWTGTSESDSWSSAYDAMNFSGTYRAVTTATSISPSNTNSTDTIHTEPGESQWTFPKGSNVISGRASRGNIVPKSFSVDAGDDYVWNDDGEGHLVFTSRENGTPDDSGQYEYQQAPTYTTTTGGDETSTWPIKLPHANVKDVSVTYGGVILSDNGNQGLTGNQDGGSVIHYDTGTIDLKIKSGIPPKTKIAVNYSFKVTKTGTDKNRSGSGTILYPSGAWSIQISGAMPEDRPVTIRYAYYDENSSPGDNSGLNSSQLVSTKTVSGLTVSQNGQNLSITLNNGIVMSGKFTNVQQTGKVNQDTNAGYNTYNAQFQVQTKDSKMVGSLNYDLQNGFRMMNGTWTWGKNTYDVRAVGPAWLNSADASTLSPGVLTK